jgi:hypothetical protein
MIAVRLCLAALLALAVAAPARCADASGGQGAFLGVLFGPTPDAQFARDCYRLTRPFLGGLSRPLDVLAAQVDPPGRGVTVTQVLPNSPAERSDLRRGDVLLSYNGDPIRGCQDFVRRIQADKPDHKVKLVVRRDGREQTVDATLALGPALRIAPAYSVGKPGPGDSPRAFAKPQSSVSVSAAPMEDGKLKVIIEYFQDGKPASVTCRGDADAIKSSLDRPRSDLPDRERLLARAALDRLFPATRPRSEKSQSR